MITLNLLPPKEKEMIIFEKSRRHLLFFGKMLFLILIVFITLLFSFYLYLAIVSGAQNELIKVTKEAPESQKLEKIKKDIQEIDSKITEINRIQKDFVLWSKVIEDLINSTPGEVYLKNISGADSQIIIYGLAQTREHLIDFEQALKESERFFDVYSPVSNFLKKTDVDFNLTLKFKK